ncbi:MAG TPA: hypothetical protein VFB04_13790 [Terriglobales bacterium]|nr:hypothetical protein [Terriglobales bacterium]
MNKFFVAIGAYALLALLAWTTLSDPKFKFATLAILAMFALRTWSWNTKLESEKREEGEGPQAASSKLGRGELKP